MANKTSKDSKKPKPASKNIKKILLKENDDLNKNIRKQTVVYITSAFGLVAGLAWNEAAKALIEYLIPISANTAFAKLGYAVIITIIAVIVSAWLLKLSHSENE